MYKNDFDSGFDKMVMLNKTIFGFVFLVFIAACGLGVWVAMFGDGPKNQHYAETEAREYARALYPGRTVNVSCQASDTDRNGYVSCTMVLPPGTHPVPIECANWYSPRNSGCRPMRLTVTPDVGDPVP